jgi:hypothetical protein
VIAWSESNGSKNHFDPDVLTYPKTEVMAGEKSGETIGYLPVQIAMCEAFAPKPGLDEFKTAELFKEFVQVLHYLAAKNGIGEIFVPSDEPGTMAMLERHGFTKSQVPMWVMKVR